eukprot:SAG31_NODE_422_length_15859_cov_5.161865_6_plen_65_part_00
MPAADGRMRHARYAESGWAMAACGMAMADPAGASDFQRTSTLGHSIQPRVGAAVRAFFFKKKSR